MLDVREVESVSGSCPKCKSEIDAVESGDSVYFACRRDNGHYLVRMSKAKLNSPAPFSGQGICYVGVGARPPEKPCDATIEFINGQGICPSCKVLNTLARDEVRLLAPPSNVVEMRAA